MFVDKSLEFSDSQAVTVTAGSTNILDLGVARDIGSGEKLELVIQIDEAVTADGAAVTTFELRQSANANMSSPDTLLTIASSVAKGTLIAGYQVCRIPLPPNTKRYLDVYYTVGTGPWTAGKVSAFITTAAQQKQAYASGFAIL